MNLMIWIIWKPIISITTAFFLAALDDYRLIGTGAIRKLDRDIAELKRIWLLDEYHGQGIGFRLVNLLFNFARAQGY